MRTRYGGRYVQAIEGVEGDLAAQRDWFWFVNGIEGDRSAAEIRLRPGDVAWWDFRGWAGAAERRPVVVGAFPEPFLHGWDGHVRPAAVRYAPGLAAAAKRFAARIGADSVEPTARRFRPRPMSSSSSTAGRRSSRRAAVAARRAGARSSSRSSSDVDALLDRGLGRRRRYSLP